MNRTVLGRTGLEVSVAGLGAGGGSRLGRKTGKSFDDSVRLVHAAVDLGVNFIDTAPIYGTEPIIGAALAAIPRDRVVLSTKAWENWRSRDADARTIASLDRSLRDLKTDYIDVFHLHGVTPGDYADAVKVLPALLREQEKGKIRWLGITEYPPGDHRHEMLRQAFEDDWFDVVMLAFSMLNQNARARSFPGTRKYRIGTLIMFAVRNIFSFPGRLQAALKELAHRGEVPDWLAAEKDPLGFLIHPGGAGDIIEAAYRFCRHEPGVDVTLFGTGDLDHLKRNIESLTRPPLPDADRRRLVELFGALEGVGLEHGMAKT